MAFEIEHKYLVLNDSFRLMTIHKHHIVQGYLSREPKRTVRIRRFDNLAFITIKGKNSGDTRIEFEYEIPIEDFIQLINLSDGRIIEKTRHIVEYEGYKWEIDEFHGELAGLIIAEIELPESTHNYPLPPFIGKEVTSDPTYYNSNL